MPLVPTPKNCDPSVKKAIQILTQKVGLRSTPIFTSLTLSKTCTLAAGLNVLRITGLQADGVAMTGTLRGAYIDVSNGSTAATGTIRAMELKARTEAPGDTGNDVNVLEGLSISADSKAHNVTTLRAAEFILDGKTAGTIDEAVGLRIANNLQIDKATVSYGLQIYRDSFDYTADIQLSNGATIGTLTSSGLDLKLDADNNYLHIGYLKMGGERIIAANGPGADNGITINSQGTDGVYFNLSNGGSGGVYFYNGTTQKLAWFGGTTHGQCRVYDQDYAEWLQFSCYSGYGQLEVGGSGTPLALLLNVNAHSDVWMFSESTSGETKGLRVYGYKAGDAKRYLDITTGGSANDTVDFTGLSNYKFGGNLVIPDTGYIGSASDPNAIQIAAGGEVSFTDVATGILPTTGAHLATKEYVDLAIGASSDYFLSDNDDAIANYHILYETDTGEAASDEETAAMDEGNNQLMFSFITASGVPGVTFLRSGIYVLHTHLARTTGNRPTLFYWTLSKRLAADPFTETVLMTSEVSSAIPASMASFITHAVLAADEVINDTDRLVLKLHANVTGGGADSVITIYMEGSNDCHLTNLLPSSIWQTQGDMLDAVNALGDIADNEFLVGTGAGTLAWESGATVRTSIGLDTWAGTTNITTLGTIATGTWQSTDVGIAYGGTGQSTAQLAINALSAVSGATNEHVLTKDTGTGNAVWKVAAGGGAFTSRCSVWRNATQSVPNTEWTKILLNTEDYDIDGEFDNSSDYRFQPNVTGYYHVSVSANTASLNAGKIMYVAVHKNGSVWKEEVLVNGTAGVFTGITGVACDMYLLTTDFIELWVYHNHGANLNVGTGAVRFTYMDVHRFA